MIDILSLALTHGLIALALWRMLFRADLDLDLDEGAADAARKPWRKPAQAADEGPPGA